MELIVHVMTCERQMFKMLEKVACLGERTLLKSLEAPVSAGLPINMVSILPEKLESLMAINAELRHLDPTKQSTSTVTVTA